MKYRLKKDLPFAKVGYPVEKRRDEYYVGAFLIGTEDYDMTEWIEEVKPREWYAMIFESSTLSMYLPI